MKPLHRHDCTRCRHLGSWHKFDVYICEPGRGTVISRYGSEGSEYCSWPFGVLIDILSNGDKRCVNTGTATVSWPEAMNDSLKAAMIGLSYDNLKRRSEG